MASVSGVEWGRGGRAWGEVRSERIQFRQGLVGHREEFGFHSRSNVIPLEGFKPDHKVFFWTMLKSLDFVQRTTGTHQRFKSLRVSGLEPHFIKFTWAVVKTAVRWDSRQRDQLGEDILVVEWVEKCKNDRIKILNWIASFFMSWASPPLALDVLWHEL